MGSIPGQAGARERRRMVFDESGASFEVPVMPRSTLTPGRRVQGPVIVEDFGATIRVLGGQSLVVRDSGVLVIADGVEGQ